jgi:hypothetical protein
LQRIYRFQAIFWAQAGSHKAWHDKLVSLVECMLELHKHSPRLPQEQEKEMVKREIESTDGRIDRLVYELPQGG